MTLKSLRLALLCLFSLAAVAQPFHLPEVIANLDFDQDGADEFRYGVSQEKVRELPEIWEGGFGVYPVGQSRFLRSSNARIEFSPGEMVDQSNTALTNYLSANGLPPIETFAIPLVRFRAIDSGGWSYTPILPTGFETRTNIILGLKVYINGATHYGWMHLVRPENRVDVPFEMADAKFHPVEGMGIPAGEPPPPPEIRSSLTETGIRFEWDPGWPGLTIESTSTLTSPISWAPEASGATSPVSLDVPGQIRYFRFKVGD